MTRRFLEDSARDWLGHCVAIFICGPAGLAEAIRQHAVLILAMPGQGMVPGFACRRCGAVGATAPGCAHPGSVAFAVPDLIEEIAVSTLHDGGQVQAVPDPPGGIAAYLRFPLRRGGGT